LLTDFSSEGIEEWISEIEEYEDTEEDASDE
jgi:hypothetical protein